MGYAAKDLDLAARIALKSYDVMFQFFNQRGFPVALAKVAEAMGIGQQKSMTAADAPKLWRAGKHQAVMDYVMGDSQITNQVVAAVLRKRKIRWVTGRGTVGGEPMPRLRTVDEVLRDPPPDQSWMDRLIPRGGFTGWMRGYR